MDAKLRVMLRKHDYETPSTLTHLRLLADTFGKASTITISLTRCPAFLSLSCCIISSLALLPICPTSSTKQLEIYRKAEETTQAIYLILDVGHMGNKATQLKMQQDKLKKAGHRVSEIVIVDALPKASASKRK